MVVMVLHIAAPSTKSAPISILNPSPSPNAMRPIPAKEIRVPSQARLLKVSFSNSMAKMAVMIGLILMMKLAAPADTVFSPTLRSTV